MKHIPKLLNALRELALEYGPLGRPMLAGEDIREEISRDLKKLAICIEDESLHDLTTPLESVSEKMTEELKLERRCWQRYGDLLRRAETVMRSLLDSDEPGEAQEARRWMNDYTTALCDGVKEEK